MRLRNVRRRGRKPYNTIENDGQIFVDVLVGQAEDDPTLGVHISIALSVVKNFSRSRMRPAVEFDHQLCRYAGEVRYIWADWMLSPKAPAGDATASETGPENQLCVRHFATQVFC